MDLGAAAEEIAGVYLAILLFATLVAHLLAVVLCTIPWFASWRPARCLSITALTIVSMAHATLAWLGAWQGAILSPTIVIQWHMVLVISVNYVLATSSVILLRREPAADVRQGKSPGFTPDL